ncbi:PIR Superfamily Protein [Plasmodium ovale wallikeri]|uniref:PIR Superfamily Protein n=1 Tax=Plasmodium ovale wallikeri TaxID=864142 RepID=A0A1A9AGF5_PLAOA|nr:PIR Superfamily Protein [Plasmodium ovale wallikeri]SBT55801.1 PIR Superfamily Protein [Plasmodium ovale wallikeri]
MVQQSMCNRVSTFNKNTLHSNLFLNSIFENEDDSPSNEDIRTFTNKIELYYSNSILPENTSIVKEKFIKMCQKNNVTNGISDEIKYCRDMNYYLDLVTGIIKSSKKIPNNLKDKAVANVEQNWEKVPNGKITGKCTREANVDSLHKRCILKQLYDLVEDKDFIKGFPVDYKKYLNEKWDKIIEYANILYGNLYIKIENDSMGIIGPYSYILNSIDYICDAGLPKLSLDDITISTDIDSLINTISLEKISANDSNRECYNKTYIDMLKKKTSDIQRVNNLLSIGIALLGFTLILIFLYNFSPLGSLLRRFAKKKIEIDENMSEEEMSELYDNSENERQYISYNSVSQ